MIKTIKLCDCCLKSGKEVEATVDVKSFIGFSVTVDNMDTLVDMHLCAFHAGCFLSSYSKKLSTQDRLNLTMDMGWTGGWC